MAKERDGCGSELDRERSDGRMKKSTRKVSV